MNCACSRRVSHKLRFSIPGMLYRLQTTHFLRTKAAMGRTSSTYKDALTLLNSTQSGFKALEERRRHGQKLQSSAIAQMREWLRFIGYSASDLDKMNIVHVAGTKGKGTTCAFVNSILQQYQSTAQIPRKLGLYTSPHLVAVRERIRINSEPISEEKFAQYFFEVWDAFEMSAQKAGQDPAIKPVYFRFLTLMSFHVFMREGIDTAIYEVGVGGERDSTNVVEKPAVTGITTLGIDHVMTLGDTIEQIAWHKAGIIKTGCPAFTVEQVPKAMAVLEQRAEEKGVKLVPVTTNAALHNVALVPAEDFQKKNASLAIALSCKLLEKLGVPLPLFRGDEPLPKQFIDGLKNVAWRGRCEVKVTEKQSWYFDGAHNEQSLEVACRWFGRLMQILDDKNIPCALIFNQQSTRDAAELLRVIHRIMYGEYGVKFAHAIFCTNVTYKDDSWKVDFVNNNVDPESLRNLTLQQNLADVWLQLDASTEVQVKSSIESAVGHIRQLNGGDKEIRVLVTGSFHLVGGTLSILEGPLRWGRVIIGDGET